MKSISMWAIFILFSMILLVSVSGCLVGLEGPGMGGRGGGHNNGGGHDRGGEHDGRH